MQGDRYSQQWHVWTRSARVRNAAHVKNGNPVMNGLSSWVHRSCVTGRICTRNLVLGVFIKSVTTQFA